jgi:alkaline phosphatase D
VRTVTRTLSDAVGWEVADDEGFGKIVRRGESIAVPQLVHSVHVEVDGLEPDRWYWYRFHVGDETSPVGRARTAPAVDAAPEKLRFAFASCQHFESGLYTAYEHMAKEDLDLVIHLGDYIYEGGGKPGGVRQYIGGEINSLEDYRTRHAQYKTDTLLQAMHARCPWLVTWDDHELENNYAAGIAEDQGVERAGAAGDDGPRRFQTRRWRYVFDGSMVGLRRRAQSPAGLHRHAASQQPHRADWRHPLELV